MADIEVLAGENLSLRSIGIIYVSASIRFDNETNINTKPEFVLVLDNQGVEGIQSWSLEIDGDVLDVTSFGEDWRKYIQGLKNWKLEFSAFHDSDPASLLNNIIQTSFDYDIPIVCVIYLTAFVYYVGELYLENKQVSCDLNDLVITNYKFQGSGELEFFLTSCDSEALGNVTISTIDSSSNLLNSVDLIELTSDELVDVGEDVLCTTDFNALITVEAIVEVI